MAGQDIDTDTSAEQMTEIQSFFKDSSVFITGATGFLGHVLLAKLLKSCPGIKTIYILVRSKKGKTAHERFEEMLQNEVFGELKKEYSQQLQKVYPVAGDCLQPKLGLSEENRELLRNSQIVFHVAATVKFDAPLKYAVHMNVRATRDLLDLAREMKQLKSFVHVSTAFSNCVDRKVVEEKLYAPPIPADTLMNLVDSLDDQILERITPSLLGNYPNTYIFTKAAAENLCQTRGAHLPLTIIRPAIVISSAKEPIPGWINNVYGPTGCVAACAVGLLRVLLLDPNSKANVVPCDYVVNAAIASAWNTGVQYAASSKRSSGHSMVTGYDTDTDGSVQPSGEAFYEKAEDNTSDNDGARASNFSNGHVLVSDKTIDEVQVQTGGHESRIIPVYNYSCEILTQPFTWKEFIKMNQDQEPRLASAQAIWAFTLTFVRNERLYQLLCFLLHIVPAFLADTAAKLLGREPKLLDAYQKLHKLAEVLSYFSTQDWLITNNNVWSLWKRLSEKDKETFDFNLNNIDWFDYYYQHCFGIRKFILKESPKNLPFARKKRVLLLTLHYSLIFVVTFSCLFLLINIGKFLMR